MATPPRILVVVALLLLATAPALSVAAKVVVVGDRKRWAPGVNYTEWADRHEFHVGDWLGTNPISLFPSPGSKFRFAQVRNAADFKYEKDRYDVVQVNETAYDKCDGSSPILSYSRGHNFPFQLNRTGRFYFICSRGYCWNGMKVSVLVRPAPPPPPAVAPSSRASRVRAAAGVWRWVGLAALPLLLLGSLPFRV
jgi:hypothetical protein